MIGQVVARRPAPRQWTLPSNSISASFPAAGLAARLLGSLLRGFSLVRLQALSRRGTWGGELFLRRRTGFEWIDWLRLPAVQAVLLGLGRTIRGTRAIVLRRGGAGGHYRGDGEARKHCARHGVPLPVRSSARIGWQYSDGPSLCLASRSLAAPSLAGATSLVLKRQLLIRFFDALRGWPLSSRVSELRRPDRRAG